MFSLGNLAFVVSAILMAIALIVAGLVVFTAKSYSTPTCTSDDPSIEPSPELDKNAREPQVTSMESTSELKGNTLEPLEQPEYPSRW